LQLGEMEGEGRKPLMKKRLIPRKALPVEKEWEYGKNKDFFPKKKEKKVS